ncbi:hypothetical protein TNCT_708871 [Trichonephila clavata]|uniref:Uncharacterized protein n=1 Tax=Trichonephila clavata TaxID=2740835 RepID=A0A8X6GKA3_TRICU|nr:hypothetical protein TNCT_708871 [Trichonephila clavata]
MVGLVVGLIRFIWEFSYSVPSCASQLPDLRPDIISKVHYLHFGILLFLISCMVTIAVSYATEPIAKIHLPRLLFWNRYSTDVRVDIRKRKLSTEQKSNAAEMGEINSAFQDVDLKNNYVNDAISPEKSPYPVYTQDNVKKHKTEKDFLNEDVPKVPIWKKILFLVCGVSSDSSQNETPKQINAAEDASLAAEGIIEKPLWRRFCNANAILLLVISSFIWGYYA